MILDIGGGILISVFTSQLFNVDLTFSWILLGIGAALLPDVDVLWSWLRKGFWWKGCLGA